MYALLATVLVGVARGACLADAVLTGIGYTPITPYKPNANNTLCKDALGTSGMACVNLTEFYTTINAKKIAATQTDKTAVATAAATYLASYNNLTSICTAQIVSADLNQNPTITTSRGGAVAINATMVQQCNDLIAVNSTVISSVASLLATDGVKPCYDFVWNTTNGAGCLAVTTSATNFTTVGNNTLGVIAQNSTAASGFSSCASLVFTGCVANTMAALLDTTTNVTTSSASFGTACGNITALAACVASPSTCATATRQATMAALVTPAGAKLGAGISTTLSSDIAMLSSAFNTRLLQAAATPYTTSFTFNELGYAVETANTGLSTNSSQTTFVTLPPSTNNTVSIPFVAPIVMSLIALMIN